MPTREKKALRAVVCKIHLTKSEQREWLGAAEAERTTVSQLARAAVREHIARGPTPKIVTAREKTQWTATLISLPGAYGRGKTREAAVRDLAVVVGGMVVVHGLPAARTS